MKLKNQTCSITASAKTAVLTADFSFSYFKSFSHTAQRAFHVIYESVELVPSDLRITAVRRRSSVYYLTDKLGVFLLETDVNEGKLGVLYRYKIQVIRVIICPQTCTCFYTFFNAQAWFSATYTVRFTLASPRWPLSVRLHTHTHTTPQLYFYIMSWSDRSKWLAQMTPQYVQHFFIVSSPL